MATDLNRITFTTKTAQPLSIAAAERPRLRYGTDTIVFLHGLGCEGPVWEPLLGFADEAEPRLNAYRLISVDLPGHGATPAMHTNPASSSWKNTIIDVLEPLLATDIVHVVAHSASLPFALQAMHYTDEYYHPERQGTLGSIVSVEGNHTLSDCGIVSRRISEQPQNWYVAGGHIQIGQELAEQGTVDALAWSRMWARADARTVWGIAMDLCQEIDYVELEQYWNAYPYRSYIWGEDSQVPKSTRQMMGMPYVDPPTARYSIPSSQHFPMVVSPSETLTMIATALQDLESLR
jgi:hypothetical protein